MEPQTTALQAQVALAGRILDALPQTQCTRCGYPDCAAYAGAIAAGQAPINQCPPGGIEGIGRLAHITGLPATALNPAFGVESSRKMAFIDEDWCIGCTLCIDACPTDAIVGSNKHMHTVIEAYCTGCELCLPVCPVDCIFLEDTSVAAHAVGGAIGSAQATGWAAWPQALADTARQRYEFSSYRRKREKDENAKRLEEKAQAKLADLPGQSMHTDAVVLDQKRAAIQAALERARAKRQAAE